MKTGRILLLTLTAVVTLVTFSSTFAVAETTISKKEVKALIKNAKTPSDHLRIAEYYRQEAARLNQEAKHHAEMAVLYKQNPPNAALEAKHGSAVEGASHCNRWAELSRKEAEEAKALATLHQNMAKDTETKYQSWGRMCRHLRAW